MSYRHWFSRLGSRRTKTLRPALETLEHRLVPAVISYTSGTYAQNFDGLPASGTFSIPNSDIPVDITQDPIDAVNLTGWQFTQSAGTPPGNFAANDGSVGFAGAYSFGTAGASDRALGAQSFVGNAYRFGAVFENDSGQTLTSFTISFAGEQWRDGGTGSANALPFDFAVGGSDIDSGSFTTVSSLAFSSIMTAPTPASLDGNQAANRTLITATVSDLNWAPGQTLAIRWNETGIADGLAVDDLSFTAAAPKVVYVNPSFPATGSIADLDPDKVGSQAGTAGVDGFQSIAAAQTALGASGGSIVVWPGTYATVPALTANQTLVVASGAVNLGTLAGPATSSVFLNTGASLTVNGGGATTTFAGTIAGGGSLVRAGTGGLDLTGQNTYFGGTTIKAGTLIVGAASAGSVGAITSGPLGTSTVTFTGGSLDLPLNASITVLNAINVGDGTIAASVDFGSNPQLVRSGTDTFTIAGPITLEPVAGGSAFQSLIGNNFKTNVNFTGAISGPGGLQVNYSNGNVTLSGMNTYSGGTRLLNGLPVLNAPTVGSVGDITSGPLGTGTVTILGGGIDLPLSTTSTPATLTIDNAIVIGDGTSATTANFGANHNSAKTTDQLTIAGPITLSPGAGNVPVTHTINGNFKVNDTFANVISGISGMLVNGQSGTILFAAGNTFSGGTTMTGSNTTIAVNVDSVGTPGAIVSGPFGTGPVTILTAARSSPSPASTHDPQFRHLRQRLQPRKHPVWPPSGSPNIAFQGPATFQTGTNFIAPISGNHRHPLQRRHQRRGRHQHQRQSRRPRVQRRQHLLRRRDHQRRPVPRRHRFDRRTWSDHRRTVRHGHPDVQRQQRHRRVRQFEPALDPQSDRLQQRQHDHPRNHRHRGHDFPRRRSPCPAPTVHKMQAGSTRGRRHGHPRRRPQRQQRHHERLRVAFPDQQRKHLFRRHRDLSHERQPLHRPRLQAELPQPSSPARSEPDPSCSPAAQARCARPIPRPEPFSIPSPSATASTMGLPRPAAAITFSAPRSPSPAPTPTPIAIGSAAAVVLSGTFSTQQHPERPPTS